MSHCINSKFMSEVNMTEVLVTNIVPVTAPVVTTTTSHRRNYGPVIITLENVLLPPEKLNPSPSAQDDLDEETETFLRVGGSELIQTSGILLKLPQTAMATGQVIFQRFYYSKSFVRQPMEVTAMACIYLASKIEEAPRRIRDVINVFHHIRQYRAGKYGNSSSSTIISSVNGNGVITVSPFLLESEGNPDVSFTLSVETVENDDEKLRNEVNGLKNQSEFNGLDLRIIQPLILDPSYVRLKNDVMLAERRVLKELGFCVHVKHPHKLIVIYLQQLSYDQDKNFVQMSWNYMNDALRTNVFVRFTPEAIACACIFLSARMLKIALPNTPNWYLVFDVKEAEVIEIAVNIVSLYDRPAINYEELEKKVEVLAKAYLELKEKGRSTILSGQSIKDEKPSSDNQTPDSRPSSPSGLNSGTNRIPEITITSAPSNKSTTRDNTIENKRGHDRLNGDIELKKIQRDRERERESSPKRMRRTPSPIVFDNNSTYSRHRSPTRHKHKKRKKSKYSSSRSRSRSPRGDRSRTSKKAYRRRTPSPGYRDYHHKSKKANYYSSSDRYKGQKRHLTS